jgi:hypothetical protein
MPLTENKDALAKPPTMPLTAKRYAPRSVFIESPTAEITPT